MASAATATSDLSPPIYDVVKVRIQHLLSTHAHSLASATDNKGLSLTELCREYEKRYNNEHLPFQELGYQTLTRFLSSMKDVVRMDFNEWPAKCYLRPITNRQTDKKTKVFARDTVSFTQENNKRQFKAGSPLAYANVEKNIILLLQLSSETNDSPSLTFTELCHQYADKNNGQPLPYEQLGYSSLQDLLETMWDRIRVDNRQCYLIKRNKGGIRKGQNTNKYHEN